MKTDISSFFVNPNEIPLFSLKNGNMQNWVSGEGIKNEKAVITDKRLYYVNKKGIINVVSNDEKIDLEDITGTKIVERNPIFLLILAALAFLSLLFAGINAGDSEAVILITSGLMSVLVLVALYACLHKKFLYIEYAGGNIHFSLIGYSKENIICFQNTIYLAKERLKSHDNRSECPSAPPSDNGYTADPAQQPSVDPYHPIQDDVPFKPTHCPNCGCVIESGSFCPKCGSKI